MKPIPLIVGFGGLSAAGRSAFHIAYNRLVIEEIDKSDKLQTFASLAIMMNLVNYEKEQFYTLEKKKISLEEIEQKYGDYIKKNTLDPHEAKFLKKLADSIDISREDFDKVVESKITEKEFEETIKDFRKKKMVYSFFLDMIALTIADGIIQDNEHKLLARVCNELGLQLNFMHNLLYFSLSSSYTQLDELFEPIYQTFFDTVLHWIKELDALIFNQTTFSINPEVDSLLKRLYKNYTL